jgi:hypothetical protein
MTVSLAPIRGAVVAALVLKVRVVNAMAVWESLWSSKIKWIEATNLCKAKMRAVKRSMFLRSDVLGCVFWGCEELGWLD